jgi:hypothetical protein
LVAVDLERIVVESHPSSTAAAWAACTPFAAAPGATAGNQDVARLEQSRLVSGSLLQHGTELDDAQRL